MEKNYLNTENNEIIFFSLLFLDVKEFVEFLVDILIDLKKIIANWKQWSEWIFQVFQLVTEKILEGYCKKIYL